MHIISSEQGSLSIQDPPISSPKANGNVRQSAGSKSVFAGS